MTDCLAIHGNALQVVPTLQSHYDLCVFDPPADLPIRDCVRCLEDCHSKADGLLFYGVRPAEILDRMQRSPWDVDSVMPIIVDDIVGWVFGSGTPYVGTIEPWTVKGIGTHPSAKGESWYNFIEKKPYMRSVLDPFAGLGRLGRMCKNRGIAYTGIELDYNHFRSLQGSLK